MTTPPVYPLKQVIEVKQRRVEEAEKVVKEKQAALEKEEGILKQKEADRDKAKKHSDEKLKQMREEMDKGTTSPKIQQMKSYHKLTKERLAVEEKKVKEQKVQVETAQKNLEAAQANLKLKRQEVDKLYTHQKDWTKEMKKEQEIIEAREQDEIGSTLFSIHHPRRKQ